VSNCAYINTLIPMRCLHTSMNVDDRNFFQVKNSVTVHCLNRMSSQPSIFTSIEVKLETAVASRLYTAERRDHVTVWNQFYAISITLIKDIIEEAKLCSLASYTVSSALPFTVQFIQSNKHGSYFRSKCKQFST
jgi:hypothetical protein